MLKNRIREFRNARGMSQRQLASKVSTSQQQIQRIEAGVQAARLDIAARICAAFDESMDQVFPATKKILKKLPAKGKQLENLRADETRIEEMEHAGIDMDPKMWTLKFRLRGGTQGMLSISGLEQKRLWNLFQNPDKDGFIVFDATAKRIALSPKHLLFWQFLFDPPYVSTEPEKEPDVLSAFFADSKEPLNFEVDADEDELGRDDNDGSQAQLQGLLFTLELHGGVEDMIVSFEDVDGERAFFRCTDLSMIEIPLWAVEPALDREDEEDIEVDEPLSTQIQ